MAVFVRLGNWLLLSLEMSGYSCSVNLVLSFTSYPVESIKKVHKVDESSFAFTSMFCAPILCSGVAD